MIKYWPILVVIVSSIMSTYVYDNPGNKKEDKVLRIIGYISSWTVFIGIICSFIIIDWKFGLISIATAFIFYSLAKHNL